MVISHSGPNVFTSDGKGSFKILKFSLSKYIWHPHLILANFLLLHLSVSLLPFQFLYFYNMWPKVSTFLISSRHFSISSFDATSIPFFWWGQRSINYFFYLCSAWFFLQEVGVGFKLDYTLLIKFWFLQLQHTGVQRALVLPWSYLYFSSLTLPFQYFFAHIGVKNTNTSLLSD